MAESEHGLKNSKPKSNLSDQERLEHIKDALARNLEWVHDMTKMDLFEQIDDPVKHVRDIQGILSCRLIPWKELEDWAKEVFLRTINLSKFEDEEKENNVPRISEKKLQKKNYDVSYERCPIFFPGLRSDDFSCELLANYDYLIRVFKDTGVDTWENHAYNRRNECTMRWSTQFIPVLYRMTCQWEISELDEETLRHVSEHFKLDYHRCFMMERTKQNIYQAADANIKSRAFMFMYDTDDGLLIDFMWLSVFNFGIFTRTGVLIAYNACDLGGEMEKCFHLCRKQMLEYFQEKLEKENPIEAISPNEQKSDTLDCEIFPDENSEEQKENSVSNDADGLDFD